MSRFLNFVLTIGLAVAVVYLVWFKKPDANLIYIERTTVTPPQTPITRLSAFAETQIARIFIPLSEKDEHIIMPTSELMQIRASLVGLSNTKDEHNRNLYLSGIVLCDQFFRAISRREDYSRRFADSAAKRPVSLELTSDRRDEDIKRKWRFFNEGIMRNWAAESVSLREQVTKQYDYMRLLEK